MSNLKEQRLHTRTLEKNLSWYRWIASVCVLILVACFLWKDTFIWELRFITGIFFVIMIYAYINTARFLRRLRAANAQEEYILGEEFRVATFDKDGNEIEEDDHTNN